MTKSVCFVIAVLCCIAAACSGGSNGGGSSFVLSSRTSGHLSSLADTVSFFYESEADADTVLAGMVDTVLAGMVDSVMRLMEAESNGLLENRGRIGSSAMFRMGFAAGGDTLYVPLYREVETASGTVSGMPYVEVQIMDGLRRIADTDIKDIAFVEGHGEHGGLQTESVVCMLANYYNVFSGVLDVSVQELMAYEVLVVAGPVEPFSEKEKYVLDQYVMHGGKLLLLLDGFRFSQEMLDVCGESPSIYNDVNLSDMLFTYGMRVNGDIVLGKDCSMIGAVRESDSGDTDVSSFPWYFAPVLASSEDGLNGRYRVKAEYVSSIDFLEREGQKQTILLSVPQENHILEVPDAVSLRYVDMLLPDDFFSASAPVVTASLHEGRFTSSFCDRVLPAGMGDGFKSSVDSGAVILCSSSSVLVNSYASTEDGYAIYPAGYDNVSGAVYDNLDFILWCVDYLAGKSDWTYTAAGIGR